MEIVKVKLVRDYSLFDRVHFKGSILYVDKNTRNENGWQATRVYDYNGVMLGKIVCHWSDYGSKLLKKVD